jgi:cell division protein ZapA (FtsZ GTPase activity inhibitor)
MKMKDYEQAVPCFNKVLSLDKTHYIAAQNLSICLDQLKASLEDLESKRKRIEKLL